MPTNGNYAQLGARSYGNGATTGTDTLGGRVYGNDDDMDNRGARINGTGDRGTLSYV